MGRDELGEATDSGLDWLVRPASQTDAVALAELRWSWQVGVGREPAMAREEFTTAFERWFGDHRDTHVAFLAEVDGVAAGMAWLALIERVPGPAVWHRLAGSLQSVFVEPSHRDRGLGAALTAAVIDDGVARRLDYLIVHPSQARFPSIDASASGRAVGCWNSICAIGTSLLDRLDRLVGRDPRTRVASVRHQAQPMGDATELTTPTGCAGGGVFRPCRSAPRCLAGRYYAAAIVAF